MKNQIDLHVHTTASDGVYSPTEVVKKAKEKGLVALGITDHDTINGLKEAILVGKKLGLEIVPGVEITTYWNEQDRREFHILGYYFNLESKLLNSILNHFQEVRIKRAEKIVKKLQGLNFIISYQDVRKLAKGTIGRPHLARAIIENKQNKRKLVKIFDKIPEISEFIEEYIILGKSAFVEKAGLEPKETIKLIHQNNGLAILAHPGWDLKAGEEGIIKQFIDWQVDGLEAIHSKKTKEDSLSCIQTFSSLAKKYSLLITGGSDFHADKKEEPGADLGLLNWNIKIPYELLGKMKKRL